MKVLSYYRVMNVMTLLLHALTISFFAPITKLAFCCYGNVTLKLTAQMVRMKKTATGRKKNVIKPEDVIVMMESVSKFPKSKKKKIVGYRLY